MARPLFDDVSLSIRFFSSLLVDQIVFGLSFCLYCQRDEYKGGDYMIHDYLPCFGGGARKARRLMVDTFWVRAWVLPLLIWSNSSADLLDLLDISRQSIYFWC